MAKPLNSFVLVYFFLALWLSVAFSCSKHDYPGLKSLHFTLYEKDILNKTDYMIVKGVDTQVPLAQYSAAFGSIFASHDPLTVTPNATSKEVGSMEGISMISGLDGLQTMNVMKVRLSLKKHKGSISIVGAVPNTAPGDMTVVGGTGDFMFVQGYVTASLIHIALPASYYKLQFHLYWPPYATYFHNFNIHHSVS